MMDEKYLLSLMKRYGIFPAVPEYDENGNITNFPIIETSLTPVPAEHKAIRLPRSINVASEPTQAKLDSVRESIKELLASFREWEPGIEATNHPIIFHSDINLHHAVDEDDDEGPDPVVTFTIQVTGEGLEYKIGVVAESIKEMDFETYSRLRTLFKWVDDFMMRIDLMENNNV